MHYQSIKVRWVTALHATLILILISNIRLMSGYQRCHVIKLCSSKLTSITKLHLEVWYTVKQLQQISIGGMHFLCPCIRISEPISK